MLSFRDLAEAFENLKVMQARLRCYPACVVSINDRFEFSLGAEAGNDLRCYLPEELLARIVGREVHWNNAELACLIEFDRTGPYLPDVHTLLSFFHLPRPRDA